MILIINITVLTVTAHLLGTGILTRMKNIKDELSGGQEKNGLWTKSA